MSNFFTAFESTLSQWIVAQVIGTIKEQVEQIDFSSIIDKEIERHNFDDDIEEAIKDYDFDDTIEEETRKFNFDKVISEAVDDYDFDEAIDEAVAKVNIPELVEKAVKSQLPALLEETFLKMLERPDVAEKLTAVLFEKCA